MAKYFFSRIALIVTILDIHAHRGNLEDVEHNHSALCYRNNEISWFLAKTLYVMADFNKYLFLSPGTYRILFSSAPFYGIGRILDCKTQNYFYNAEKHKNIHQLVPVFKKIVDPLMGISISTLILLQFFSRDEHTRYVSHVFLSALPFLWAYKNIIKQIPCKGSIRPKNEHFSPHCMYYGGFPSGHTLEAVFMAYLFGTELGPSYMVPLSAFATLVIIQSVTSNRHTLSQVVAGAALGAIFGAASKKVVTDALHHKWGCGIIVNRSGFNISFERKF